MGGAACDQGAELYVLWRRGDGGEAKDGSAASRAITWAHIGRCVSVGGGRRRNRCVRSGTKLPSSGGGLTGMGGWASGRVLAGRVGSYRSLLHFKAPVIWASRSREHGHAPVQSMRASPRRERLRYEESAAGQYLLWPLSNLPTGCGKECTGVRSRDLTVGCHVHKSFQLQLELLSRLQLTSTFGFTV